MALSSREATQSFQREDLSPMATLPVSLRLVSEGGAAS